MFESPHSLKPEQVAELHRWEHFLVRFYMGSILTIMGAMVAVYFLGEQPWVRRLALLIGLVLMVIAAIIQMRVRCPNCKGRLGFPSKMRFPDFCPRCLVHFPRPESETRPLPKA